MERLVLRRYIVKMIITVSNNMFGQHDLEDQNIYQNALSKWI